MVLLNVLQYFWGCSSNFKPSIFYFRTFRFPSFVQHFNVFSINYNWTTVLRSVLLTKFFFLESQTFFVYLFAGYSAATKVYLTKIFNLRGRKIHVLTKILQLRRKIHVFSAICTITIVIWVPTSCKAFILYKRNGTYWPEKMNIQRSPVSPLSLSNWRHYCRVRQSHTWLSVC